MMSAEPSAHEASNPKNKKQYGYYQPTGFHLYCDDGPLLDSCKSLQSGNAAGALKTLLKAKLADGQRYKVMNNKAAAYLLNQDIRSAENHLLTAGNIADSDYDNTVIRNNLRILTNLNPYYSIPRSPDALP